MFLLRFPCRTNVFPALALPVQEGCILRRVLPTAGLADAQASVHLESGWAFTSESHYSSPCPSADSAICSLPAKRLNFATVGKWPLLGGGGTEHTLPFYIHTGGHLKSITIGKLGGLYLIAMSFRCSHSFSTVLCCFPVVRHQFC